MFILSLMNRDVVNVGSTAQMHTHSNCNSSHRPIDIAIG